MPKRARPAAPPLELPQGSVRTRAALLSSLYDNFEHTISLRGSRSCVNAMALAPSGRLLASGGDDTRVLLWNSLGPLSRETKPRGTYEGHTSNVFSVAFSAQGGDGEGELISGGINEKVYVHTIAREGEATTIYTEHDAPVRSVSTHPTDPYVFLSASEDGTLRRWDTRTATSTGVLRGEGEMNDVAWNPALAHLFGMSDGGGLVGLLDGRTAWKDDGDDIVARLLVDYHTKLLRPLCPPTPFVGDPFQFQQAAPDASSLSFSPDGKMMCAVMSRHLPTLYELNSPVPLAVFGGEGYANACTIKHGSFSNDPTNLHFAAGSDDFAARVWKVPSLPSLLREKEGRMPVSWADWTDADGETRIGVCLTKGETIPTPLNVPSSILTPHRSIVNTALFHPSLPLLFTSGIEKTILVHSPTPFLLPETFERRIVNDLNAEEGRSIMARHTQMEDVLQERLASESVTEREQRWKREEDQEDRETLELFDVMLWRETEGDELWDQTGDGMGDPEGWFEEESSDGLEMFSGGDDFSEGESSNEGEQEE